MSGNWAVQSRDSGTIQIDGDGKRLYQLCQGGRIYQINLADSPSHCELIGNNPATVGIVCGDRRLYAVHGSGRVYRYGGFPLSSWTLVLSLPGLVGIAAAADKVFALDGRGEILALDSDQWSQISSTDKIGKIVEIAAAEYQSGLPVDPFTFRSPSVNVYARSEDGRIWQYKKKRWTLIGSNSNAVAIAAAQIEEVSQGPIQLTARNPTVYRREKGGTIRRYSGTGEDWVQISKDDSGVVEMVASGLKVFRRNASGSIYNYLGPTTADWTRIGPLDIRVRTIGAANETVHKILYSGEMSSYVFDE